MFKNMRLKWVCFVLASSVSMTFAQPQPKMITVNGDASVMVPADQFILALGVETHHQDLQHAKSENDATVAKILAIGTSYKIPTKSMRTDFLRIEPLYHRPHRMPELEGYKVQRTVVLTADELQIFDQLLSRALSAGANRVIDVQFRTSKLREHRDQARRLAVRAAADKANALAAELGQVIGGLHWLQENGNYWHSSYGNGIRGGVSQNTIQNFSGSMEPVSAITAPGLIQITAGVRAGFSLE